MKNEKVSGEISSDAVPKQAIREISLVNKNLILSYTFTWEGNTVDALVGSLGRATRVLAHVFADRGEWFHIREPVSRQLATHAAMAGMLMAP